MTKTPMASGKGCGMAFTAVKNNDLRERTPVTDTLKQSCMKIRHFALDQLDCSKSIWKLRNALRFFKAESPKASSLIDDSAVLVRLPVLRAQGCVIEDSIPSALYARLLNHPCPV
jgi:hypothetical protein